MPEMAPGWELYADRGGEWLFVKLKCPDCSPVETPPVAEWVWRLLEEQRTRCLILEMDEVRILYSYLIGQLILLLKRISTHGGTMRLCGVSPHNQEALRSCHLDVRFPPYRDREAAVAGRSD
jgi:anti-anti-sigma factor